MCTVSVGATTEGVWTCVLIKACCMIPTKKKISSQVRTWSLNPDSIPKQSWPFFLCVCKIYLWVHFTDCFTSLWTHISVFTFILHVMLLQSCLNILQILMTWITNFPTHRGTHYESAQAHLYDQHTRGMGTTRYRSLVERGGRKDFVSDEGLAGKT